MDTTTRGQFGEAPAAVLGDRLVPKRRTTVRLAAPVEKPLSRPRDSLQMAAVAGSVCLSILISLGDAAAVPELTFSIFYLVPISLVAWVCGKQCGIVVALITTGLWVGQEFLDYPPDTSMWILYWNAISRLCFFVVIVLLVSRIRDSQAVLAQTVAERTCKLEAETARRLAAQAEIAAITDREKERIGHELHDGLGQYLAGLSFRAKALEHDLASQNLPQAKEARELTSLISDSIRQAKSLAKGLAPIDLQNGNLVAALQSLARDVQNSFKVPCLFHHPDFPAHPADPRAGLALYRICQESIHNAFSHGEARMLQVQLCLRNSSVVLRIKDDGKGFVVNSGQPEGMGLHIMRLRAESIGGSLEITSSPGEGTEVCCEAPVSRVFKVSANNAEGGP